MSILDINQQTPPNDNRNQPSKMSVDLAQAMDIECSSCGNKFFHEVVCMGLTNGK